MKVSCAIIEDDVLSTQIVEKLAERTGLLQVNGKFAGGVEALPWLLENRMDLLFLDVEMPGMTGMELMRSLPYKPEVIVISAKHDYAVEAFDLSVTDYLVKPILDYGRFLTAINKVLIKLKPSSASQKQDDNLFVKVDSLLTKLNTEAILYVEAFGDYIKIHTHDKVHTVYSTLKKIEDKLDSNKFVRVHRSFLVNVTQITNIDPNNLEINKKIIPVSATYKDELLGRISVL